MFKGKPKCDHSRYTTRGWTPKCNTHAVHWNQRKMNSPAFLHRGPSCILPAMGDQCRRACTDTKARHAGACQQQDLREKQDQTASSSAIPHPTDLQGFSSTAFSFLHLLSPNGNNTDSILYFIMCIFSS